MRKDDEKKKGITESFVMGGIALVFLLTGYQTALFVHRAAVTKIAASRDAPDTVYIYRETAAFNKETVGSAEVETTGAFVPERMTDRVVHKSSGHSPRAEAVRRKMPFKEVECFMFDPNTASVEDFCRLGFTVKQAESIDNYRKKGGRFRRKSDFAKSYVVSDSVFRRLEPYIDIPLLDLNRADSAAFDALPGIGGWFAARMVEHRDALGGYSYIEQLMDIRNFDKEKFDKLYDLVMVDLDRVTPYPLWTYPADSLRIHPYIKDYQTARSIVLFRENNPSSVWSVAALEASGILSADNASRLSRCVIASP